MKAGIALALGASVLVAGTTRADGRVRRMTTRSKRTWPRLRGRGRSPARSSWANRRPRKRSQELAIESELAIKDGKATRTDLATKKVVNEGMLKLDPTAKPKAVDIMYTSGPVKGETDKAIYEIDGDTLKVCYSLEPDAERPTEFASKPDGKVFVLSYKRVKK